MIPLIFVIQCTPAPDSGLSSDQLGVYRVQSATIVRPSYLHWSHLNSDILIELVQTGPEAYEATLAWGNDGLQDPCERTVTVALVAGDGFELAEPLDDLGVHDVALASTVAGRQPTIQRLSGLVDHTILNYDDGLCDHVADLGDACVPCPSGACLTAEFRDIVLERFDTTVSSSERCLAACPDTLEDPCNDRCACAAGSFEGVLPGLGASLMLAGVRRRR